MAKMLMEQGLFFSPKDSAYIEAWIEKHPPQDRIHLYTASGMTWNLASRLTDVNRNDLRQTIHDTLAHYFYGSSDEDNLRQDITIELEGQIARFLDLDGWDNPVEESE